MRNASFFCFLMLLGAVSCNSEMDNGKSDLALSNLKGKVWKIDKTVHDTKENCNCPASMRSDSKRTLTVYDKNGNITELSTIGDDGNVLSGSKFSYDRNGKCLEVVRYKGETITGKDQVIQKGGKMVEVRVFNRDGIKEKSYSYKYSGDLISEEITRNDLGNIVSTVTYTFSGEQLDSQTETDADGNVVSVSRFRRNSNNDVVEFLISVPRENRESRFTFEYEYDDSGNWIKQTQFYEGTIQSVVLRNITYFDQVIP